MPQRRRKMRGSVVLLSGGMDSATCLALATHSERPVHVLSVSYGQRHARELRSAGRLAEHFRADDFTLLDVPVGPLLKSALTQRGRPIPRPGKRGARIPSTYVPARNTVLLALALALAESRRAASIYIGVNAHDYSGYPDCRPEFLQAFRRLIPLATQIGTEGRFSIALRSPLVRLTKAGIVRLGQRLQVPWEKTWSCYRGQRVPCGRCDACALRAKGFREAGVEDPLLRSTLPRGQRRHR